MHHRTCEIDGCNRKHAGRGLCRKHYDQARHDPNSEAPYTAVHLKLRDHRGRARDQRCVDCGEPAQQWSYDHADPNELLTPTGLEYSADLAHYDPRCNACHRTFDQQHRRSGIPRLQQLAAELEPQIREAIHHREKARKHNDLSAVDEWDDELERLTAPLRTTNYLPLAPGRLTHA
jgi:hypothetical protein